MRGRNNERQRRRQEKPHEKRIKIGEEGKRENKRMKEAEGDETEGGGGRRRKTFFSCLFVCFCFF